MVQEPQADRGQVVDGIVCVLFSRGDDQDTGHVVGAVAVFVPGLAESGVFECAPSIGHAKQVVEVGLRCRVGHHTNAGRSARSRLPKVRNWRATTGHPRLGAKRDASAAMPAASPGLRSTRRKASARPSGSW